MADTTSTAPSALGSAVSAVSKAVTGVSEYLSNGVSALSSRLTMPEVATTAALAGVTLVSAYAYSLLTRRLGGRAAGLGAAAAVVYDQAGHVVPAWEGAESASGTCPGAG